MRLLQLRQACGLSQTELAQLVGTSQKELSFIENGRKVPPADLAQALASELDVTAEYLIGAYSAPLITRPWLRAYADAPATAVERQLADCALAVETVERLRLRTVADTIPVFNGDANSDDDIENYAHDVRSAAQIPDGAIVANAMRAAERLGCFVLPMPDELGRHLGMSTRVNGTPVVCVGRSSSELGGSMPGDRQRFTISHELGHLGLHGGVGPPQTADVATLIEKQAHRFAGAFLTPADALLEDLAAHSGRVTLSSLARLKEHWGVAIKMLVMRLQQLGVIGGDHARSLYKQISARGWNKAEPVQVHPEQPVWLEKALEKAFGGQDPSPVQAAARAAGLGDSHFRRWLDFTPREDAAGDGLVITAAFGASAKQQSGRRVQERSGSRRR